jgi:DNA-binding transcriptional ArsR family regulator
VGGRCSSSPTSEPSRSDLDADELGADALSPDERGADELSADDPRPRGLRDLDDLDAVFGALAHRTRRHILQVMHARAGAMTAGELASRFAHSWPTTTRHLRVLVDAGLVSVERNGRERHYLLRRDRLTAVLALWLPSVGLATLPATDQAPPATGDVISAAGEASSSSGDRP